METGRPRNVKSPEQMWELFEAYVVEAKTNPFLVQDYVGKDGIKVERERERPLTFEGFKNYCRKRIGCVHDYFANSNDAYSDFSTICRAIKDEIRQDQIEGGMASIYNPSITQRLNGLVDKTEVDVKTEPRVFNINPDSE